MSNTAVIIRKIKNDITFEHLLYILVCERQYYYDNSDRVLSNKELVKIAQWAMGIPVNELNPKQIKHPKFKVDKAYWRERGITARQAANIVRGILKSQEIGSMYDFNLTDKENIQVMKDYGIKVSLITLKRWRKNNGIKVSNKKQSIKSKQKVSSEYNNKEEEHYIGMIPNQENDTLLSEGNNNNTTHKQMKKDNIKQWYNPQLTDDENIKVLKDKGINISAITLKRWRKTNGITKQRGGDHCSEEYKKAKCK